ncbi:MAG: signal peptide-containing protein [Rhodopirellula sp. JB044]|uniref:signal peptide-containing protein n=1 Tax=Rhodopirellula sp. JB044 TaxID=3342844 RepID=UPI00370C1F63
MLRIVKFSLGAVAALIVGGFVLLGANFTSYLRTSARAVQESVQESVPLEFELRRARDLIDEILPELQSQVRVIAEEEVAIQDLKHDLDASADRLSIERSHLAALRDQLRVQQVSYRIGDRDVPRDQLAGQLRSRLERFKQSELSIDMKTRLLEKREEVLGAALFKLEKMRNRKVQLEQKVEMLIAQERLQKASRFDSDFDSKSAAGGNEMCEADELLDQIETRLAVAQRVLEHEQDVVAIPLDDSAMTEDDILSAYDSHFDDQRRDVQRSNGDVPDQVESDAQNVRLKLTSN